MSEAKHSHFHLTMRALVVDAGLILDRNSDATIKLAEELVSKMIIGHRGNNQGRCCDNCNCVAMADLLTDFRAPASSTSAKGHDS